MGTHASWLLMLLLVTAALAQAPSRAVDVSAEPLHKLIFSNEFTRVFRVELASGQSTQWHHHAHDYVVVHLSEAQVGDELQGGPAARQTAQFGQVGFTAGGITHRVTNQGAAPFHVLAIEILKKKPVRARKPSQTSERGLEIGNSTSVDTILDNDEVRVTETLLAPGATLEKHRHRWPYLVVALSDMELHDRPPGRPASRLRVRTGDSRWAPAGVTHALMNMGRQQARFLVVDFK
jgi:quercetin dioxygenase-like cupin family protein